MANNELQKQALEMIASEDIPPRVSNRLIAAIVIENTKVSKKNNDALYGADGKTGLIAEVRFWKKLNFYLFGALIGSAIAILVAG